MRSHLDQNSAESSEKVAAAFGLAAIITIAFNTVLACAKDAYTPLKHFMTALTGHDWITHALADVVVYIFLGWIFSRCTGMRRISGALVVGIALTVVVASGILAAWYVVF